MEEPRTPEQEALFEAAWQGDIPHFKALLEAHAHLRVNEGAYEAQATPLHYAAAGGQHKMVHYLLAQGADANQGNNHLVSPLRLAAEYKSLATVQVLLAHGAGVNAVDDCEQTVLHWVLRQWGNQQAPWQAEHQEIVRSLVAHGAELGAVDEQGHTALHMAADTGALPMVEVLLAAGSPLHVEDRQGQTPLHRAAYRGHEAVVGKLLQQGALLEVGSELGQRPLHLSARMARAGIVGKLLQQGALLEVGDKQGQTPLHWAAMWGHKAVVEQLAQAGADLERIDSLGRTALHQAAYQGQTAVVQWLHERYGVSLGIGDLAGQQALVEKRIASSEKRNQALIQDLGM